MPPSLHGPPLLQPAWPPGVWGQPECWSVCYHGPPGNQFHCTFYAHENAALAAMDAAWGSKLLGRGGQVVRIEGSTPLWSRTVHQYWELQVSLRELRAQLSRVVIGNSGNSGNSGGGAMDDAIGPFMWAPTTQDASSSATPALIATSPAWNVCFHSPATAFHFQVCGSEEEATAVYRSCGALSTSLLARGSTVVHEWSASEKWRSSLRQFWGHARLREHLVDRMAAVHSSPSSSSSTVSIPRQLPRPQP